MPDLLGQIKRKAAHRKKEKVKLTYHIVVYSITGAPRGITSAAFTINRGEHAFESSTASQARVACAYGCERCAAARSSGCVAPPLGQLRSGSSVALERTTD